jgi:hypothetical protein
MAGEGGGGVDLSGEVLVSAVGSADTQGPKESLPSSSSSREES